ncbi:MAG: hypothetical protein ACP5O1_00815 [Phycisphaerae bacterium]
MKFSTRWPLLAAGVFLLASFAAAAPQAVQSPPKPSAPNISAAQVNQIMNFLKQTQPGLYRKALMLKKSDPTKFYTLIRAAAPNFRRLEYMRKYDPKLFAYTLEDLNLTHQSYSLAWKLRKNPPSPQDGKLRSQLLHVVTRQFELRQTIRKHIINRLLKRVTVLKKQLSQRSKDKQKIITDRIEQLTGKRLNVNW